MKQPKSLIQSKIINYRHIYRVLPLLVFLLGAIIFVLPYRTSASTLAEEFLAPKTFDRGLIVSLEQDNPKKVELSSSLNTDYLLGVVTGSAGEELVYPTNGSSDKKVLVALSGDVQVFVTNANGDIAVGDFITTSSLEGVGMKYDISGQQGVLGVALDSFSASEAKKYGEISTQDGKKNVAIGSITVRLFKKASLVTNTVSKSSIETFLTNIAGHDVSVLRIVICLIIFTATLLLCGILIYTSIRSSIISVGRNPLASSAIYKTIRRIMVLSVIIIVIGTVFSYIVLVV